jgi:hypothetical protein
MDEVAAGKHAKAAAMSLLHEQREHQASHQMTGAGLLRSNAA